MEALTALSLPFDFKSTFNNLSTSVLPMEALKALTLPFGLNSTFNNLSTSVLPMEALTALTLPFGLKSTFNNLITSVFETLLLYVFEYFTGSSRMALEEVAVENVMLVHISILIVD